MYFKLKRIIHKKPKKPKCMPVSRNCLTYMALIIIFGIIFISITLLNLYGSYKESYKPNMQDTVGHNINFMAKNLNRSAADNLYNEIQILCCIKINDNSNMKYIKYSWGKRCQKILFVSSTNVPTDWDVIQTNSNNIKLFRYIYKYYNQYANWFLLTQDDTYIIMENLRYLLYPYDHINFKPYNYPYKYTFLITKFGVIFSKEALRHLVYLTITNASYYEDCVMNLGLCLNDKGFKSIKPHDGQCLSRFIQFFLNEKHKSINQNNLWHELFERNNKDCYLPYTVSLQLNYPQFMFVIEIFLYGIHLYGIEEIHPPLPEKYNTKNNFIEENAKYSKW